MNGFEALSLCVAMLSILGTSIFAWRANSIAKKSVEIAKALTESQILLSRRQQFPLLWEHMSGMRKGLPEPAEGDPEKRGAAELVVRQVNALELIAVSCEAELVDQKLVERTFLDRYIEMTDWIESLPAFPVLQGKTGKDLMRENPAIGDFKQRLIEAKREKQQVPGLQSGA